ncbi:hypothetical protein [Pseudomonas mandelii]|uniref:hypothetical protein n=1 Tax=Pseudomonas mandelii TaxID=75612 RepID=UPI00224B74F7|nr:hypothetical protein [Pseudomonas mandelii]MCX2901037.1 hypothetical protein [Pseudomonas mandelii]
MRGRPCSEDLRVVDESGVKTQQVRLSVREQTLNLSEGLAAAATCQALGLH